MKLYLKLSFLVSILFIFSCSEPLNFDQANDYTSSSKLNASLIYFTVEASDFTSGTGGSVVNSISETTEFRLFENSFIQDNLVRIDFDFEAINSFNHDFTIQIDLLDTNDVVVHSFSDLLITNNNLTFKQQEIIDILANTNVRNFTKVFINLRLTDASQTINASDLGSLEFKSAVTLYINDTL